MHPWLSKQNKASPPLWAPPHYKPIRLLGEGGMALLYLVKPAEPHKTKSLFALKTLRPHLAKEPEARVMFRDEIRLARQLNHPSIVKCIDADDEGELMYLVVEFVEGCSLQTLLAHLAQHNQKLPWSQAFSIAYQIAQGLAYLHQATDHHDNPLGVVHRDLSPANVLLQKNGSIKLTDFGVSIHKLMIRHTWGEDLRGQFAYLAPELLLGQPAEQRSDIFSWGVLAWEMFAGQRLFHGKHPEAILQQIKESPIAPLASLNTGAPEAVCRIVDRALQRNQSERYASANHILKDCQTISAQPCSHETSLEERITSLTAHREK